MAAYRAAEEPDFTLVSCPELAEPPDRKIVLTLGTLDLDGGHGLHFFTLIIHNHDLFFLARFHVLHLIGGFNLPDIAAFTAFQLARRRD
jgi:hypothetical protein